MGARIPRDAKLIREVIGRRCKFFALVEPESALLYPEIRMPRHINVEEVPSESKAGDPPNPIRGSLILPRRHIPGQNRGQKTCH